MSTLVYTDGVPRKVAAAGALFLNEHGDVLLVNPTYKPEWEIPGGVVEPFETPRTACRREVKEEIGLDIVPGRLLGIDYFANRLTDREVLRFVFWGGVLTAAQIAAIRLPQEELSEFGFFDSVRVQALLTASLGAQVNRIVESLESGAVVYAENPVTDLPQK